MIFDPLYFIMIGPFLLLGLFAQMWVKSSFRSGQQVQTPISGAQAARRILDENGLSQMPIECIDGELSDHYDPSAKVLRLSRAVYEGYNAAAVGVAAHEAGHALQDAQRYPLLVLRNMAVPMAGIGSNFGMTLFIIGLIFSAPMLVKIGVILFAAVVFFQVVNLPVEFNASSRAKFQIANMGMVSDAAQSTVRSVLLAAAMTYVAATLQAIMTLVYLLMRANSDE
ncbi:MAG: zinc metallopeptidase [Planctomycetia bacterium]|nr:zinc metallopeptidase [Planctomycetia bacterium]